MLCRPSYLFVQYSESAPSEICTSMRGIQRIPLMVRAITCSHHKICVLSKTKSGVLVVCFYENKTTKTLQFYNKK